MVAEWLFQTVDVPLWGVFVLTAYSARRLAEAVSGLEHLRGHRVTQTHDDVQDDTGPSVSG